jgi:transposase
METDHDAIVAMRQRGHPISTIARRFGVTGRDVYDVLSSKGAAEDWMDLLFAGRPSRKARHVDAEAAERRAKRRHRIVAAYTAGKGIKEIAHDESCSIITVYGDLKTAKVPLRKRLAKERPAYVPSPRAREREERRNNIVASYVAGHSVRDIANSHRCSAEMIYQALRAAKVPMRTHRIKHLTADQKKTYRKLANNGIPREVAIETVGGEDPISRYLAETRRVKAMHGGAA